MRSVHDRIDGWEAIRKPSHDLRIEPKETADPYAGQEASLGAVIDPRAANFQETRDVGHVPQAVMLGSGRRRAVRGAGAGEHRGGRLLIDRVPQTAHGAFFSVAGVGLGTGRPAAVGGGREAGDVDAAGRVPVAAADLDRFPFLRCSCHNRSRRNSSRRA